jgi:hypothetical protein
MKGMSNLTKKEATLPMQIKKKTKNIVKLIVNLMHNNGKGLI